jgi:hypothetical protein
MLRINHVILKLILIVMKLQMIQVIQMTVLVAEADGGMANSAVINVTAHQVRMDLAVVNA